jgi:uncharacterized protein YndB with AHSA1/START domain
MTLRTAASATIRRPLADVFAFLADFHNEYLWVPNLMYTEQISPGPIGPGTTYWQMRSTLGHPISDCTITALEPNRRIAIRAVSLSSEVQGTYEVAAADGGTLVTIAVEYRPRGIERLLTPFLRRAAERQLAASLARLVAVLDKASTPAP